MLAWQAARQQAQKLTEQHGTNDPYEICRSLGIDVVEANLPDGSSGMIVKRAYEDAEIFVEADHSPERRRFTVAHELGHYMERTLADDEEFSFRERRGMEYDLHEFFADEFAGALLMPEADVVPLMRDGAGNTDLARRFEVSLSAVEKRRSRLMKTQVL